HGEGWPPPDSYSCAPVLAANVGAIWRGRRLKVGQVRVLVPGQEVDHVTTAHHYQFVSLAVDGDLFRKEAPVLAGCDLEERLAGTEAITTTPAYCRTLWSHLVDLLDLAQARPDLLAQRGRLIEQECLRRFVGLLTQPNANWTACRLPNRVRLV